MEAIRILYKLMDNTTKKLYFFGFLGSIFSVISALLVPLFVKFIFDYIISNNLTDIFFIYKNLLENSNYRKWIINNIWVFTFIIVIINIFNIFFTYINEVCISKASENLIKNLRDNLFNKIQNLPFKFIDTVKTGDLIQRSISDIEIIKKFIGVQINEIFKTFILIVFVLFIMININLKLSISSVLIIPIIFFFSYIFYKKIKSVFAEYEEVEAQLSSVLQENITGIRIVKAFTAQKLELEKFESKNNNLNKCGLRLIKIMAYFWSISHFMCYVQIAIVTTISILMVMNSEITIGTLILFYNYENMLIWPIRSLGRTLGDFGKMQVSVLRIYEIINHKTEFENQGSLKPDLIGDIKIENLSFGYNTNNVISDISLEIKKGQKIGVLGTTGSGKSTLIHILIKLYNYENGSIKINNVELKEIDTRWLRRNIGVVLQDSFLFSKTIKENIALFCDDCDDLDIIEAAKKAGIHEAINNLKDKYYTMLGERGLTVSGGQKQRIAIARTILEKKSILIFDDCLSAIDSKTDEYIRKSIFNLDRNIILLFVSQKIESLKNLDKIIVMNDGKIVDFGNHQQLIKRDGLYKKICDIQNCL